MIHYFEKLPSALVTIESCGSSHHWARLLTSLGHDVKLMPPQYVKPCVKRGKNDAADAEALCEAVTRRSPTRATPRGLLGNSGEINRHSVSLRSERAIANSSAEELESLNLRLGNPPYGYTTSEGEPVSRPLGCVPAHSGRRSLGQSNGEIRPCADHMGQQTVRVPLRFRPSGRLFRS
jgi:hypothetical protein